MRKHRLAGPGVALAAVAAMVLVGTAAPADPGKGAPAQIQPEPQRTCSLRPNQHASELNEWASCLSVNVVLTKAPAVGETVPISFEVTSQHGNAGVSIEADLPANLRWVKAPEGLKATSVVSASPLSGGSINRASAQRSLVAATPVRFEGSITAVAKGAAEIRVRALHPIPGGIEAADDAIYLTVGSPSILDIKSSAVGATVPIGPIGKTPEATPQNRRRAVPTDPASSVTPQATSCVTGGWFYVDNFGATRPSINMQVEAWEGGTRLTYGVTGWDGRYNLCFANTAGGKNVYVRWVTRNNLWRVRATGTNNDYAYASGAALVADGANRDYGNLQPADGTHMRGLHAFDAANSAWNWKPGTCWDTPDVTCRQVVINWSPTSTDGTYYSTGSNDVHLAAADPDAPTTVIHEIGHAVMDDVYEDAFPSAPSCNPHSIQGQTSTGCAWTEGWAEWFPASVLNDPFYRWPNGASLNLETPTWGTGGWGVGDATEGRIAGSLIDLSDCNNEGYWDVFCEGAPGPVWTTFTSHVSNTLAQFWGHRAADGFNVSDAGGLSSLYQNTVDYTFRNPLYDYAELNRPIPTPHNYGFNTSTIYWSVAAVRPPVGGDFDLTLYDDRAQGVALGTSAYGGNVIDFVAVDSNHRALGDYYPRAYLYSGAGNYQVELAQGAVSLPAATSQPIAMGSNDVVVVRDVFLTAGVAVTFSVTAGNGGQDAELFVLASDGANAATWVRTRGLATATASAGGPGAAETITFTPTVSDWYGLVLLNKAGSGTYTLSRS